MSSVQPQGRRAYKRIEPQIWNGHKEVIRELFLDQGKTHQQVVGILADRYGFNVGVRQLKRRMDDWGIFRNIPSAEMNKMVRKRAKRQDQLGRRTKFMRRNGDGALQDVPQERLDAYQKRFGYRNTSMSQSSGMPSNIVYQTPSTDNQVPSPSNSAAVRSYGELALEFNTSVEQTFGNNELDFLSSRRPSRTRTTLTTQSWTKLQTLARADAHDGNYSAAGQKFKLLAQMPSTARWVTVAQEFNASLMEAASYSGCPQSIIARIADLLSRFLVRERQHYGKDHPEAGDVTELRKTLTALKMNARHYGQVVSQQRALQIWEPILGQEHPMARTLRANLAALRDTKVVNLDHQPTRIEAVDSKKGIMDLDEMPRLRSVRDLLQLEDGPPDLLLEKFRALQSSDVTSAQAKREIALLRHGRSQALLGVYYSFLGRFDDAEKAFQESTLNMEYEVCVEIKLHRLLWYAEHKTRVQHWDGVGDLLHQAHVVFMRNELSSDFIIHHFPGRFASLCKAVSQRAPIDKVSDETVTTDGSGVPGDGSSSVSAHQTTPFIAPSPAASSILSPQRLFPPTPRGTNFAIDIDAWRQFVQYSPVMAAVALE